MANEGAQAEPSAIFAPGGNSTSVP